MIKKYLKHQISFLKTFPYRAFSSKTSLKANYASKGEVETKYHSHYRYDSYN